MKRVIEKGMKRVSEKRMKRIRELARQGKIELAPDAEAQEYDPEVREFLWACMGVDRYLITDESLCSDFHHDDRHWQSLAVTIFGIPFPDAKATVVEVAKAIRANAKDGGGGGIRTH